MYDKFGHILRVETVINRPRDFSVYRTRRHRDGTTSLGYFPMNKDVGSLVHYQEQSPPATAAIWMPWPSWTIPRSLPENCGNSRSRSRWRNSSSAGFNPARREDVRLFAAVLDGDHIARGFRNRDIRARYSVPPPTRASTAPPWVVCSSACTIANSSRIPRTRRWRVTDAGRHLLSRAVQYYRPNLARTGRRVTPKTSLHGEEKVRSK